MTTLRSALARQGPFRPGSLVAPWLGAGAVTLALAGVVGARWFATTRGIDALATGAAFGLALTVIWLAASGSRATGRPDVGRIAIAFVAGTGFGLVLVALAAAGASIGGSPIVPGLARPAAPFLPWAAITIVVAAAEEGILRGVLFDRLRTAGGVTTAVLLTTVLFALLHVPLYGWHVVPLDLAVGLGFAGLRLSSRTVVAPVAAHAVADLATWWL